MFAILLCLSMAATDESTFVYSDSFIIDRFQQIGESIKALRNKQETIEKEVAKIGPIEALVERLERTITRLFWCVVVIVATLFIAALAFAVGKAWIIKQFVGIALITIATTAHAQEIPEPTIVMYTSSECVQCDRWRASILPKLIPLGWNVLVTQGKEPPYPSFLVRVKQSWKRHEGFMTIDKLREIVEAK